MLNLQKVIRLHENTNLFVVLFIFFLHKLFLLVHISAIEYVSHVS